MMNRTRYPVAGVKVNVWLDPVGTVTVASFVPGGEIDPRAFAPDPLGVQETEMA
jgi:hypothetical protein